jgi:hypothetical protein
MKHMTFLPLAILFLSAGAVKSQAPVTAAGVASSLQDIITANKALIDKQQKTLDGLDQISKNAQELKDFVKRG